MTEDGIARLLDELGFERGCIVETIVATRNPDASPSAAPMGVVRTGPTLIEIRPFKTSLTFRNLVDGRGACVNVTDDPELFLVTAFKDEPIDGYKQAEIDQELSMALADASIPSKIMGRRSISENREAFICQAYSIRVKRPLPRVFSRGRAEAIEAIVHATRIKEHLKSSLLDKAEELSKRVRECKEVVDKVSTPESKEARVVQTLIRMIEGWREQASR